MEEEEDKNRIKEPYELILNANENYFPFNSLNKEDIRLYTHAELEKGTYTHPQISSNQNYFGVKCHSSTMDIVYIWKTKNPEKPLYSYAGKCIYNFCFTSISNGVIIIYANKIIYYNIETGKIIVKLDTKRESIPKPIVMSSSPKGRYFALGSLVFFTVWDILDGKELMKIKEISDKKYLRKDVLVSITDIGEIRLLKYKTGQAIKKFKVQTVKSSNDILSCMLSEEMNIFYFLTKRAVYSIHIKEGTVKTVIKYDDNSFIPIEGLISPDCRYFITTNKEEIDIWEEGSGEPLRLFKERFNDFSINFDLSLLLTVDSISLSIVKFSEEKPQELNVWVRENPTKFDYFVFSPDGSVLLTIINEYNAILWNCETGTIIKEWYHEIEQWSRAVEMVPDTSMLAVIATKSFNQSIKVWSYTDGSELMTFVNFDCYAMCFSAEGDLLAAGAKEGSEVARIWSLTNGNHNSFYNKTQPNKNTVVALVEGDVNCLIAHSSNQHPIMYSIESSEMVSIFKCDFEFDRIKSVQASPDCTVFYSHGYINKKRIAVIWRIGNKGVLREIGNCLSIEISKDGLYLLTKTLKTGSGQKVIELTDISHNMKLLQSDETTDQSCFYQDCNSQINITSSKDKSKFSFIDIKTNAIVATIDYTNKSNEYFTRYFITYDEEEHNIIFRHITLE